MEYKWLNKKNNKKLIVFFNGWGMDENVVKHLKPEDYDVIMFYDYNNLDMDLSLLEEYEQKHLVSWSMGVMTATLFNIKYNTSTAINGTLKPIDDKFGIPVKIYDLTLNNFNQNSSQKFIQNMFEKELQAFVGIKCTVADSSVNYKKRDIPFFALISKIRP